MRSYNYKVLTLCILSASFSATAENVDSKDSKQLDNIVVTASGFKNDLKNAPASISVITQEEISQKNATNIPEMLTDVPGVDIRSGLDKTGGLNVEMRGMPAGYTLMLKNGRRQNPSGNTTPNGFGGAMNNFTPPVSAIQRIEVVRGPMSTLYGSDAMGGVINIITKPTYLGAWRGNITVDGNVQQDRDAADYGSLNLYTAGAVVPDLLGLEVRGRLFKRNASERLLEGKGRDPRPGIQNQHDIGAKLTLRAHENHDIWLDAESNHSAHDNKDSRLGTLDTAKRQRGYKDTLTFKRQEMALGHDSTFDWGEWNSYVSRVENKTVGRTLPAGNLPEFNYVYKGGEDRLIENTDTVFNTQVNTQLANHKLIAGLEYQHNELKDGAAGAGEKFKQDSWAVFAEDTWSIIPSMHLTFGGRYQHHKAFGGEFTPRTYAVWNLNDQFTLKGGVGMGYKVPQINQLQDGPNGFTGQGTIITWGSPNLKPEKSINYELGLGYQAYGLDVDATVFFNQFKDKIASGDAMPICKPTTPAGTSCIDLGNSFPNQKSVGQQINIDKAQTYGLELASRYQITSDWNVKGSYTFLKSEIKSGKDAGEELTNPSRHALNLTTSYAFTDNFNGWLGAEYRSSRKYFQSKPKDAEDLAIYNALDNKISAYAVLNMGVAYNFTPNLKLSATIHNLLDTNFGKKVAYSYFDTEEGKIISAEAPKYMSTGRSIGGTYIDRRRFGLNLSYDW